MIFPRGKKDKKIDEKIHVIGRHRNRHGEQIQAIQSVKCSINKQTNK